MQLNNKNVNNTHKKPRRRKRRKHSKNNNKSTKSANIHQNPSNQELSHSSTQDTLPSIPNSSLSATSNVSFSSFISNKREQKMEENSQEIQPAPVCGGQNDNVSVQNVHQTFSKSELKNVYIREKKICFLRQLPERLCKQSTLESSIWFGYPGLIKTIINFDKKQAHIIYDNESSAQQAIQFAKEENLLAAFGTKRYCDAFIETGKHCGKYYCTYTHEWCKPEEVVSIDTLCKASKGPYSIKPSVGTDLMKRLENENEYLRDKCRNLQIDNKQWQIKYDNLNDKYNKLKCKFNEISNGKSINIYRYKTWNCEQVYQWIIWDGNYNGYFKQFATDIFYNNLKLENIDGSCLPHLSEEDIYRIGITDFKAKKLLMKSINELIEKTATTCDGSNGKYMDQIVS